MKIFHFDFNTAFFNRPYLENFIRKLKECGYDTVLWELEDFVRWDNLEHCFQSDSISKSEMAELLQFTRSLGMENIPLLQCLGHCEYVLSRPEYAAMADTPGNLAPYCPSNPQVQEFLERLLNEYMELFADSRFIHLGCDEVWHLGDQCPACKKVIAESGKEKLLADHINFLNKIVNSAGKEAMIWADMLLIHPQGVQLLDKNIIMVDWRYELRLDWQKLWMWDERGGRLIDESEITDNMRQNFGKYLYKDGKLNIFYTVDFLLDNGFRVITAGASACYPDNFLLGKAVNHICNSCSMMLKSCDCMGYLHTSWTVHYFDYELQPAIEIVRPTTDFAAVMEEYTQKNFRIPGKKFFELLMMLEPRVLFSGAGSTGHGKELKDPYANIIKQRLQNYQDSGILADELAKTTALLSDYQQALAGLKELRTQISSGYELFDRYIFSAEALVNRAKFGIYAASEFLHKPHNIDRDELKAELQKFNDQYYNISLKRMPEPHARRATRVIFGTLLEYFEQ